MTTYTKSILLKAKNKTCQICRNGFNTDDIIKKNFHYSKTNRGSDIYIHKKCLS